MVNMKINEVDNLIVLPNRRNVAVFKKKDLMANLILMYMF